MANEKNLKPKDSSQSREEAKKNGSKGGIASGKARREKKAFRESFETILSMPLKDGSKTNVDDIQSYAAINGKNITVQEAITIAVLQKAMEGDVKAAEYIRNTIGQKPMDKLEVSQSIDDSIKEMEAYFEQQKRGNT